jgi:cell division protease FtsH
MWISLLVLIGIHVVYWFLIEGDVREISYSEFKKGIQNDKFSRVMMSEDWIKGTLKDTAKAAGKKAGGEKDGEEDRGGDGKDRDDEGAPEWRATPVPGDETLVSLLDENGIEYGYVPDIGFWIWLVPLGLLLLFFMARRGMSAAGAGPQAILGFGKSGARVHVEADTGVTFDDVAGAEEAVEELKEITIFLTTSARYRRIGARIPRGVLLVGPPGTGKTLLARAVAGHAGVPFFSLSGSEFMEMFVGVGAARVRDLFRQAQARSPSIIFIDELDALAKSRDGARAMSGHDEREQTLNQLLSEMDGFDPHQALIVLAATNRPGVLDPALLRPGRFDRQVLVDRPDRQGRQAILEIHVAEVRVADDVDLETVARSTPGFTGADLANVVNEAALLAVRRDVEAVHMQDLEEAVERVVAGLQRRSRRIGEEEKRIVAYHESGHALVALELPHTDPVRKVSIVSRGLGALGYTMQVPEDDRHLMRFEELRDRMAGLLGGRAAEQAVFGQLSTGAGDDLRKATDIARDMVVTYGMSEAIGPVSLRRDDGATFLRSDLAAELSVKEYGEKTSELVDREIRRLVDEALQRARRIIDEHRDVLEAVASHLIENEVVTEEELRRIAADRDGGAEKGRGVRAPDTIESRHGAVMD